MAIPPGSDSLTPVTQASSEALHAEVAAKVSHPNAGIFGPASLSWRINRESALFLGAGRAAILQLAHPWVTASLAEHSTVMNRPIDRFHNTFRIVFTMIFGSLDQALAAARHLHVLHTRIQGEMPEDVAHWEKGSRYQANEIGALRWVFATLVESAVFACDCTLPALSPAERESYYAESKTLASLFGLPAASLPENWAAFTSYNRKMHASGELGVSGTARQMAHNLLRGAGSWVKPPFWYRAMTIESLPERFREEFDLPFGAKEQRAAARAGRLLPRFYRRLPASIRFVGPWHEAQARLAQCPVGSLTRWSNRFWIGRSLLPFA
jgi:uncharacterized protein (DUF2236 family)